MRTTVLLFLVVLPVLGITVFQQGPRAVQTAATELAAPRLEYPDGIPEGAEAGAPPPNDDFANATVIAPEDLPFTDGPVPTKGGDHETGEPWSCGGRGATVWYRFTPKDDTAIVVDTFGSDYNTVLAVYSGESLATLTEIACNHRAGPGPYGSEQSRWSLKARAAVTYYFRVGGGNTLTAGTLVFHVRGGTPPSNDDFANATVITALPFTDTGSTEFATTEPDEAQSRCLGTHAAATVWYSIVPSEDMFIVADTNGSDFTTFLVAWTEGSSGLTEVTCTSQLSLRQSRFAIQAVAGQTYYFQVGGFSFRQQAGTLAFNLQVGAPPANDDFADATVITTLPFSGSVDTVTATSEQDEPDCGRGGIAASAWYRYTPGEDTILVVNTAGTDFSKAAVGVYMGNDLGSLTTVACWIAVGVRRFGFVASAGQTYFFQVGTLGSLFPSLHTGHLAFRLDSAPIPRCPAPQSSVSDPIGDLRFQTALNSPDIVGVSGSVGVDNFCLTVDFAEQVDPPDAGTDRAIYVEILFDTDENPDTGYEPHTEYYCGGSAGLGVDASIFLWGGVGLLVPIYSEATVPDAVIFFDETSLTLSIPLSALGDGLPLNFVVLAGPVPPPSFDPVMLSPSDCVPDSGFIHWPAAAGDASCNGTVNSIDAALVLQFDAALITSLRCMDAADADQDGAVNSEDAALILQYDAGLIDSLPP